ALRVDRRGPIYVPRPRHPHAAYDARAAGKAGSMTDRQLRAVAESASMTSRLLWERKAALETEKRQEWAAYELERGSPEKLRARSMKIDRLTEELLGVCTAIDRIHASEFDELRRRGRVEANRERARIARELERERRYFASIAGTLPRRTQNAC